jgi:hypothetical protein
VELTVELWSDSVKNGGWERLLQQLWSTPTLSTLRDAGSPTDSVEVWRQLAATDDASRAKPTEDHFERIDAKAPRARWADVQGLGTASEAVLVVRLPRPDPMLSVAPTVAPSDGELQMICFLTHHGACVLRSPTPATARTLASCALIHGAIVRAHTHTLSLSDTHTNTFHLRPRMITFHALTLTRYSHTPTRATQEHSHHRHA